MRNVWIFMFHAYSEIGLGKKKTNHALPRIWLPLQNYKYRAENVELKTFVDDAKNQYGGHCHGSNFSQTCNPNY